MTDEGTYFDVVEIGLADAGRNADASAVPCHLELRMGIVDILCQRVDGYRVGITRALKFTPDIKFVNDETLNEFIVTVERRNVGETDVKNDRDSDRDDREDKDREDRDKTLENSNLGNNQDAKRDRED